jgi:hypothetical protein
MHSLSAPFTLTIDWIVFTLPSGSVQDSMHVIGGDWTKSEVGVLSGLPELSVDTLTGSACE